MALPRGLLLAQLPVAPLPVATAEVLALPCPLALPTLAVGAPEPLRHVSVALSEARLAVGVREESTLLEAAALLLASCVGEGEARGLREALGLTLALGLALTEAVTLAESVPATVSLGTALLLPVPPATLTVVLPLGLLLLLLLPLLLGQRRPLRVAGLLGELLAVAVEQAVEVPLCALREGVPELSVLPLPCSEALCVALRVSVAVARAVSVGLSTVALPERVGVLLAEELRVFSMLRVAVPEEVPVLLRLLPMSRGVSRRSVRGATARE